VTPDGGPGDPGAAGPVRPALAVTFATTAFVTLLIAGLGLASLALDADVVATPGLGVAPGAVGVAAASIAFAAGLTAGVRMPHPPYAASAWCAVAAFLGYVGGVGVGALIGGADPAVAVGAAGEVAISWFAVVVAAAGLACGWGGIALVRTRSRRPRWPWEDDEDE